MADPHPRWIDLVDPTAEELRQHLPPTIHSTALEALLAPHVHDDEPRPRIVSHGDYILGILLLPVEAKEEDRLYYQEIDFVATADLLVSVSKTPPGEQPSSRAWPASSPGGRVSSRIDGRRTAPEPH